MATVRRENPDMPAARPRAWIEVDPIDNAVFRLKVNALNGGQDHWFGLDEAELLHLAASAVGAVTKVFPADQRLAAAMRVAARATPILTKCGTPEELNLMRVAGSMAATARICVDVYEVGGLWEARARWEHDPLETIKLYRREAARLFPIMNPSTYREVK